MPLKSIQGFTVIPIKYTSSSTSNHELFIKEHTVRNQSEDKPLGHTLFVLNVPPCATEDSFKTAFSCAGSVKNVIFQNKANSSEANTSSCHMGYKVAYIIFEKSASIDKALNLTALNPLSSPDKPLLTGIQKWVYEYNSSICNHDELLEEVTNFMAAYDKRQKKEKQQEKEKDDGGWITVGKNGRNPGLSRKESVRNRIAEKASKGVKRKQLDDFYTFQKRESKMKHLEQMRKSYEQDKKKVEAMKLARKFKPF